MNEPGITPEMIEQAERNIYQRRGEPEEVHRAAESVRAAVVAAAFGAGAVFASAQALIGFWHAQGHDLLWWLVGDCGAWALFFVGTVICTVLGRRRYRRTGGRF